MATASLRVMLWTSILTLPAFGTRVEGTGPPLEVSVDSTAEGYGAAGLDSAELASVLELLRTAVDKDETDQIQSYFINKSLPARVGSLDELVNHLALPPPPPQQAGPAPAPSNSSLEEAAAVFSHLPFALDAACTAARSSWWYRTADGSCNWLEAGATHHGRAGTARSRDHGGGNHYADGVSAPRGGPDAPNPRALSNAFFSRKPNGTIYYEHTPLLLGLVEFIMHDVTFSADSPDGAGDDEFVEVPMPADEAQFGPDTVLRVRRTAAVPGTGTSRSNPREVANDATTWLDLSALYGSSDDVARKLRAFEGGRMRAQSLVTRGRDSAAEYLPFNRPGSADHDVPTRGHPHVDPAALFAGGDPRTNEDWALLGVHTLLLREHNRLCGVLAARRPDLARDDEALYQTARLLMSAKLQLIGNDYQMCYWTDRMPWPRDDGFPLFRAIWGKGFADVNPANPYPWPPVTRGGKPTVVSAEMAVVYRFHELIPRTLLVKDAANATLWEQDLFATGYDARGFVGAGLENVLRGMLATSIPNFHSGVDDAYRSAGRYRGHAFDLVVNSIVHEREQGLPTFNQYFRAYNADASHALKVPIRDTFDAFSSDPQVVADLKRLYKQPDDVDLVVGVQLDEELFPGATIPKSALIISLYSLFAMGNSDRFGVGYAMMRCLLVDKPWDCRPSNALEDLLWKPLPRPGFPNLRMLDPFWATELDLQAKGSNLLWRLVTENTDIPCLQRRPLFPADPTTNPVVCALPPQRLDKLGLAVTVFEVGVRLVRIHWGAVTRALTWLAVAAATLVLWTLANRRRASAAAANKYPPVLGGIPVLGEALNYQADPRALLRRAVAQFGEGTVFGIKLAGLTHYVLTDSRDLDLVKADAAAEAHFSLRVFMEAINFGMILGKENFDSDVQARLVRQHLGDAATLARFQASVAAASRLFLARSPPSAGRHGSLRAFLDDYIAFVVSYCVVGPEPGVFDDPALLRAFLGFNEHAIQGIGLATMLPRWLHWLAVKKLDEDRAVIRKVVLPLVEKMRGGFRHDTTCFLPFILDVVEDDERACGT